MVKRKVRTASQRGAALPQTAFSGLAAPIGDSQELEQVGTAHERGHSGLASTKSASDSRESAPANTNTRQGESTPPTAPEYEKTGPMTYADVLAQQERSMNQ